MKLYNILCSLLVSTMIISCSYNSFEEKYDVGIDCSNVTYSASIEGIINANCAVSGCHSGPQFPDLRNFSNVKANANSIKLLTQSRVMPKRGSLSQSEIDLIACWVDNGALDN